MHFTLVCIVINENELFSNKVKNWKQSFAFFIHLQFTYPLFFFSMLVAIASSSDECPKTLRYMKYHLWNLCQIAPIIELY